MPQFKNAKFNSDNERISGQLLFLYRWNTNKNGEEKKKKENFTDSFDYRDDTGFSHYFFITLFL